MGREFENIKQTHSGVSSEVITGSAQTLARPARGIYVGGDGNLVCRLVNDTTDRTFTNLVAGTVYPFAVATITASGTTITNSIALF